MSRLRPGTLTALSTSTNKRKRTSDGKEGAAKKSLKGGQKQALRVVTDIENSPTIDELLSDSGSSDSLFDESEPSPRISTPDVEDIRNILASQGASQPQECLSLSTSCDPALLPASRTAPPIPGLYFDPSVLLPEAYAEDLMWTCIRAFFPEGTANQVMLFERSSPPSPTSSSPSAGLPPFLSHLLSLVRDLLRPVVPPETHDVLFSPSPASHTGPPRARQAIVNLYWPGEGITPHVDLLDRYGDGIVGVSLGSGCAMQFTKARAAENHAPATGTASDAEVGANADADAAQQECALYLPKRSVVVLTEEARYGWTHGIEKRYEDLVEDTPGCGRGVVLERDVRLSVTFRWLLPGADIVGPTTAEAR